METATAIGDDDLSFLLSLVARERAARVSPAWKTNMEAAIDEHGEACDAVWNELYRLLDERQSIGPPVGAAKRTRPELIKRDLKRDMKKALREALTASINQIVDDL